MRIIVTFILLLVAALPPSVQAAAGHKAHLTPLPYGTWVRYHQHHVLWPDGRADDRSGWLVTFPVRVVNRPMVVPKIRHTPTRKTPKKAAARRASAPRRQPSRVRGYRLSMSVTGYAWGCGASQAMASGTMPFVGAAAATLPFGTRLWVPYFGAVTVLDRGVGYGQLDLFMSSCGAALAWGRRQLMVTVIR